LTGANVERGKRISVQAPVGESAFRGDRPGERAERITEERGERFSSFHDGEKGRGEEKKREALSFLLRSLGKGARCARFFFRRRGWAL